jgi:16S rRNA (uracil1498-N3)-methyltransferase
MTRRRWIADEVSGNRAALVGEHAEHLSRVLRVRVGQEFEISTGEVVRLGKVCSIADDRVEFELGGEIHAPSVAQITLLLAVFKFDRMEWAIEKCTELGVARIVPVIAMRTEVHLAKAAERRVERWRRLALSASEHSRRVAPPEIPEPAKLKEVLSHNAALKIVLAETEKEQSLRQLISGLAGDVALAVGPEGGWTDQELNSFKEAGWQRASLGRTILRAETAAIASIALVAAQIS